MTFYQSRPVTVEAYRFDGSWPNARHIFEWVALHDVDARPSFHAAEDAWESTDGMQGHPAYPAQLDIGLPKTKIAAVGDYVVRVIGEPNANGILKNYFKVLTEDDFKATYDHSCPTCSGQVRETVNLVCQTCGHDYSKGF